MFQPARGTRDILPEEMLKRNWVQDNIRVVFEDYGYMPLGTPAFDKIEFVQGMDITLRITGESDEVSRELLRLMGFRFRGEERKPEQRATA